MRVGAAAAISIGILCALGGACARFEAEPAPDAGVDAGPVPEGGPSGDGGVDAPEPPSVKCGSAGAFCEDFDGALSITDLLTRFGDGNGEGNLSLFTNGTGKGLRATLAPNDPVASLIHRPSNNRPVEVIVEVDVRVQKIAGPVGLFSLDYFSRGSPVRFLKGLAVVVRADGRVSLDAGGANKVDTGITMTLGAWHKLRLVAPTSAPRADLDVDGGHYTNDVAYLDGTTGDFQLAFGSYVEVASGSEQVVEYDNLRLSAK